MEKQRAEAYFDGVGVFEVIARYEHASLAQVVSEEVREAKDSGVELDPSDVRRWLLEELSPWANLFAAVVDRGRS